MSRPAPIGRGRSAVPPGHQCRRLSAAAGFERLRIPAIRAARVLSFPSGSIAPPRSSGNETYRSPTLDLKNANASTGPKICLTNLLSMEY